MQHPDIARARSSARRSLPWVLLTLTWCSMGSAAPDSLETAAPRTPDAEIAQVEQYAARAFDAYQAKDYALAVALYHKAFEVAPSADLLYNIARIYDNGLRDRAQALDYYGRYVAHPGAAPERVEKVNRRIAELQASENTVVAASPRPGVRAGTTAASAGEVREARADDDAATLRVVGLASGAAGLAALGLGTLFGLGALSDAQTARAECDGDRCRSQRGVDSAKSASRQASVATLAFSLAGVLIGTGAVLWIASPGSPSPGAGAHSGMRWSPSVTASEVALQLNGVW